MDRNMLTVTHWLLPRQKLAPLAEARVEVKRSTGQPGVYNAVAWMRPLVANGGINPLAPSSKMPKAG